MFTSAAAFNQPQTYCKYQSNSNFLNAGETSVCGGSTISCGWGQTDCPVPITASEFP